MIFQNEKYLSESRREPVAVSPSAPQSPCFPTCCAKLELGSLFCSHCRTSGLLQLLAHVGLESEEVEIPAPAASSFSNCFN